MATGVTAAADTYITVDTGRGQDPVALTYAAHGNIHHVATGGTEEDGGKPPSPLKGEQKAKRLLEFPAAALLFKSPQPGSSSTSFQELLSQVISLLYLSLCPKPLKVAA